MLCQIYIIIKIAGIEIIGVIVTISHSFFCPWNHLFPSVAR
jgi:hypothetical protein